MYGSESFFQIQSEVEGMLIRGVWAGEVKKKEKTDE